MNTVPKTPWEFRQKWQKELGERIEQPWVDVHGEWHEPSSIVWIEEFGLYVDHLLRTHGCQCERHHVYDD